MVAKREKFAYTFMLGMKLSLWFVKFLEATPQFRAEKLRRTNSNLLLATASNLEWKAYLGWPQSHVWKILFGVENMRNEANNLQIFWERCQENNLYLCFNLHFNLYMYCAKYTWQHGHLREFLALGTRGVEIRIGGFCCPTGGQERGHETPKLPGLFWVGANLRWPCYTIYRVSPKNAT